MSRALLNPLLVGHSYYYNAASGQSTYNRPTAAVEATPLFTPILPVEASNFQAHNFANGQADQLPHNASNGDTGHERVHYKRPDFHRDHKPEPKDRPKHKQAIPSCSPWLLVRTKLRRRFVHNPETGESLWRFPADVLKKVVQLDRKERERRERRERAELSESEADDIADSAKDRDGAESDEYEEVEVTEDEDEDEEATSKRLKTEGEPPNGPVEFNEDDVAFQLAAMGQGDDEDLGDQGDWDEEYEEPPLSEEDSKALFIDLLDDFRINPYTPWEKVIEDGAIIDDNRYTCLPTMKSRREVFDEWSRTRMQQLKEQWEKQEKKDPRIAYFAFLEKNATPKLYWPEFKRKYKKEAELRDTKLSDKDREKAYRDYINRLKLPRATLKSDLDKLLEAQPLSALNRSTSLSALPTAVLTDLRFTSVRASDRDRLVGDYIASLPEAPEPTDVSAEDAAAAAKEKQEREKREAALREREKKVEEEKRKRAGKERFSKGMLKEGEEEVRRAMKGGRDGLMGYLREDEKMEEDSAANTELDERMAD